MGQLHPITNFQFRNPCAVRVHLDRVHRYKDETPLQVPHSLFFLCTAASSALLLHSVRLRSGEQRRERREMAEATAYEEQRRRQVEANKRKLEELQLHHLSAAVREAAAAAKPSPVCPGFP